MDKIGSHKIIFNTTETTNRNLLKYLLKTEQKINKILINHNNKWKTRRKKHYMLESCTIVSSIALLGMDFKGCYDKFTEMCQVAAR